jgi:hypothetical protein
MMVKPNRYYSYLLRLWQAGEGPGCTWCASLEQPGTGHQVGFATLDHLFAFLREQAGSHGGEAGAAEAAGATNGVGPSEAIRRKE